MTPISAESLRLFSSIPPTAKLFWLCWTNELTETEIAQAQEIAAQVDFADLMQRSEAAGVAPLVWHHLQRANIASQLPFPVRERFEQRFRQNAARKAALHQLAQTTQEHLRKAGIPSLPLKGLALDKLAYPDPVLRYAYDIDLLVPPLTLLPAAEVLRQQGFHWLVAFRYYCWTVKFWMALDNGLGLDLHGCVCLHGIPLLGLTRLLWQTTQSERESTIGLLAHVLLHGFGDRCFSPQRLPQTVADGIGLLRAMPMEWELLESLAAEDKVTTPLAIGLQLLALRLALTDRDATAQLSDYAQRFHPKAMVWAVKCLRHALTRFSVSPWEGTDILFWMMLTRPFPERLWYFCAFWHRRHFQAFAPMMPRRWRALKQLPKALWELFPLR